MESITTGRHKRKLLHALLGVGLLSTFGLPAFAALSLPTIGGCSFVARVKYPFAYAWANPGSGFAVSWSGMINFAGGVISINALLQNPSTNPNSVTESQLQVSTAPFLLTPGPIAGSYVLSFNTDGTPLAATAAGNQHNLNLIPTEDGKTILLQYLNTKSGSQGGQFVGECRMWYHEP
jgi:hypothetical protein